jgi:hypothetical protein
MATDLEEKRWRNIWTRYGLTKEQVEARLEEQGGKCLGCGKPISVAYGTPRSHQGYVDHCHHTNANRAILCHNCNTAAGFFEKYTHNRRFLKYLRDHCGVNLVVTRGLPNVNCGDNVHTPIHIRLDDDIPSAAECNAGRPDDPQVSGAGEPEAGRDQVCYPAWDPSDEDLEADPEPPHPISPKWTAEPGW